MASSAYSSYYHGGPSPAYASGPYAPVAAAPGTAVSAGGDELAQAKAEIAALRAENERLKATIAELHAGGPGGTPASHIPPPTFYPPPPVHYGYPPAAHYGYPQYGQWPDPSAAAPWGQAQHQQVPQRPANPPLEINKENKRGPKGANLAVFCLPNSYTDQQVFDLAKPYGTPVFCSVATHRDTGLSRGYAFVSFDTLEEAKSTISGLHNLALEGRNLRCEVARSDRDASAKPY